MYCSTGDTSLPDFYIITLNQSIQVGLSAYIKIRTDVPSKFYPFNTNIVVQQYVNWRIITWKHKCMKLWKHSYRNVFIPFLNSFFPHTLFPKIFANRSRVIWWIAALSSWRHYLYHRHCYATVLYPTNRMISVVEHSASDSQPTEYRVLSKNFKILYFRD